ncbi:MAG: roadblock/LC7 domain-containing protein [Thermoplasmata archaeon]
MMANGNIGTLINDLKVRIGGTATALVSRDGSVLFAAVPDGMYVETFAIMCATILGAAVTANVEFNRAPPARVLLEGPDSLTLIYASGSQALLVAVVHQAADVAKILEEVGRVAELLNPS